MNHEEILKRPIFLTEKAELSKTNTNTYIFEVKRNANKVQIKRAVEALYNVKVVEVRTLIQRGRLGRRWNIGYLPTQNWKKAMVKLSDGDVIEHTSAVQG